MSVLDSETVLTYQKRLGYKFKNAELLQAALTHSSSADTRQRSNERMEFLGDAVLGLVVCQALYEQLPEAMEGEMTKIKSAVVSRRSCATAAERLALGEMLILGQGMEHGEHLPQSLAACALEAVIAAIYLDGGIEKARKFILKAMDDELRAAIDSGHQFNYKSQLQQWAQRSRAVSPQYVLLDEQGPDHAKCFEIAVSVNGRQFASAWGPNKKDAEQKAARAALIELGELDPRDDDRPELRT